ncbi:hypothetical protein [Scytonema sp. NUACC26]|uniref:hypothetical protein n=1 Tax=Scytonema sp. NUACC26 TaxID=3140176 RepID=UPI0034DC27EB
MNNDLIVIVDDCSWSIEYKFDITYLDNPELVFTAIQHIIKIEKIFEGSEE